ncbi:MurR/RpiR family transcriptional regulator [Luteimonas sp. BDR2-5]|uniref:MurR/RpiR family transcriptional regulator n=1 Tax=Proluteimonas luteida TaxID=2878685 RepID=UPI001E54C7FC|nr:MurR/RpiR family transcriptional regulator [Luteimonas sp. BDR2-5]MCD9027712.1 MurR/RpiR family transcriptional regulator [Luteimonas sp. BDR2-5]
MPPLLKVRAERDRMSAIERRIADFVLENAHLLRDYSSQQLADALGISQSSVVKFSQKLGFKGYPDLKYSVGEAIARNGDSAHPALSADADGPADAATPALELWQGKTRAEEETRLINPPPMLDAIAEGLDRAGRIVIVGLGEDNVAARAFAVRLSLLGLSAAHHPDPSLASAHVAACGKRDLLVLFSEYGQQPSLLQLARLCHERGGRVISATRHNANPLRTLADWPLLVSAHHDLPHVEMVLYQSALQQLLDTLFLRLCASPARHTQLAENRARIHHLLDA